MKLLALPFRAKVIPSGRSDSSVERTLSWAQSPHLQSGSWATGPSCCIINCKAFQAFGWQVLSSGWPLPRRVRCGEQCSGPGSLWPLLSLTQSFPASPTGQRVPSLIIVLTGGELLPESFAQTQVEVSQAHCYQPLGPHIWMKFIIPNISSFSGCKIQAVGGNSVFRGHARLSAIPGSSEQGTRGHL